MNIMPNNLKQQFELHAEEYEQKAIQVLRNGWYILGNEVTCFEKEFAKYIGTKYCVGLASGLDALWMAFRMLGIGEGDEVIVCSNAYIACIMGITMNGNNGTPIFVEPDKYYNIDVSRIESAITDKTKAILAVHLFGQACNMTEIMRLAEKYNFKVVEDCAQSHGNSWKDKKVGSYGDIGCFSFYPSKGCGAFGDAGAITTNNNEIAEQFRTYRNYGSKIRYENEVVGTNSRLDELQAGLLRVKLEHMDQLNAERVRIAERYEAEITNQLIVKPAIQEGADSTWHQYVIKVKNGKRNILMDYLKERGIGTIIHYPIPPHLSKAYFYLGYKRGDFPIAENYAESILSLPMYNGMTMEEQQYVIDIINRFGEREYGGVY